MRKRRTFSERGCHVCEFCEKDARFPRVEFVDFPKNSLNFNEKRTNSLNVHEKRIFSEKGVISANSAKKTHVFRGVEFISAENVNFCEFCEKDVTFPKGRICFRRKMLISVNSAKKT